jgi:hypothetical protein
MSSYLPTGTLRRTSSKKFSRKITWFRTDGAVAIDNNVSEREMKRAVLNRENSLFAGNPRGGRTAAILASLTFTCRDHEIDPQLYLTQLLVNLPGSRAISTPGCPAGYGHHGFVGGVVYISITKSTGQHERNQPTVHQPLPVIHSPRAHPLPITVSDRSFQ